MAAAAIVLRWPACLPWLFARRSSTSLLLLLLCLLSRIALRTLLSLWRFLCLRHACSHSSSCRRPLCVASVVPLLLVRFGLHRAGAPVLILLLSFILASSYSLRFRKGSRHPRERGPLTQRTGSLARPAKQGVVLGEKKRCSSSAALESR